MYVQHFALVVPQRANLETALVGGEHDKIEVYSGQRAVKNYGITVQGSGAWAKGRIAGSIQAYDYEALYQVYNVPSSRSVDYWFVKYRQDVSQGELKKTFESSQTTTLNYSLEFEIQGNDFGVSSVLITYQVIRLQLDGVTKDFVTTNSDNSGAVNPDGSTYPGGFKPVPSGLDADAARREAVATR